MLLMTLRRTSLVVLFPFLVLVAGALSFTAPSSAAEEIGVEDAPAEPSLPASYLEAMPWRCIGPANMGGRITGFAVNAKDSSMYWVATASGGLLKTVNNGISYEHQFDHEATVSIGDVAVAPSNGWERARPTRGTASRGEMASTNRSTVARRGSTWG
jgi:hypothetical protein